MTSKWLSEKTIRLELESTAKEDVLKELISLGISSGKITDEEEFTRAIFDREAKITTGIGSGIAIPHAKSNAVKDFVMVFARSTDGIDFRALDGKPSHLFFLLGAPFEHDEEYLETMGRLSRLLKDAQTRKKIMDATDKSEIIEIIRRGKDDQ